MGQATSKETDAWAQGEDRGKANSPRSFSPEELLGITEEIVRDRSVPFSGPATSEVVLIGIDPYRVHAYWNVEVPDLNRARRDAQRSFAPLMLRIREETNADGTSEVPAPVWEKEVRVSQKNVYIQRLAAGATYVAELGLLKRDGTLALLARSDPVSLPPSGPSPHYDTTALHTGQEVDGEPVLTDLGAGSAGPLPVVPLAYPDLIRAPSSGEQRGRG